MTEAKAHAVRTAFLCHSHHDKTEVEGLIVTLAERGIALYVDWTDATMPASPNRETAQRIQRRIRDLDSFLFLATPNSLASRWCPWEIGFANGAKSPNDIIVIPTQDAQGRHHGNEYLQLYRHIDDVGGTLRLFEAGTPNASGVPWRGF